MNNKSKSKKTISRHNGQIPKVFSLFFCCCNITLLLFLFFFSSLLSLILFFFLCLLPQMDVQIHLEINIYTVNVMQTIKTICYFSIRFYVWFSCCLFNTLASDHVHKYSTVARALAHFFSVCFVSIVYLHSRKYLLLGVSMCRNDVNDVWLNTIPWSFSCTHIRTHATAFRFAIRHDPVVIIYIFICNEYNAAIQQLCIE